MNDKPSVASPTAKLPPSPTTKHLDPASLRTWTDATGRYKVDAYFLKLLKYGYDTEVHFLKTNEVIIRVPLERLSVADQKTAIHFEQTLEQAREKESTPTPKVPSKALAQPVSPLAAPAPPAAIQPVELQFNQPEPLVRIANTPLPEPTRHWRPKSRHPFYGRFLSLEHGYFRIALTDGSNNVIEGPYYDLSFEDQRYIREKIADTQGLTYFHKNCHAPAYGFPK